MKLGSLCTGYGGLDLAVQAVVGGELAFVSDIDKGANKVLAHRYPDVPNLGDFTKVDWTCIEGVDVLTAGFPCQPVSNAGKRAGVTDERWLFDDICDAISDMVTRPRLLVFENVLGLLSANRGDAMARVIQGLARLGYVGRYGVLRASDVGAPHGRRRIFIVAESADTNYTRSWGTGREGGWRSRTEHGLRDGALLPTPAVSDDQRRIADRSEIDPETGCWLWTGWTNQAANPYGRLNINGAKVYAHRASYEAFVGPIADGHEVDHLCQTSLCVNPEHLEAVTPEENRDRVTQRRTHCKRGHEFTEENTYWVRPGARACRACRAMQDRARRGGGDIPLLPTPACNDMGEGKTVEAWDEWTDAMQAKHGNGNGHGKSLAIEAQRLLPTPSASEGGKTSRSGDRIDEPLIGGIVRDNLWGDYADAIARWEALTRPAPAPTMLSTKGTPQLSPAFSEWMMGLPAGWVTDVPGITRNEALRALGNGVVPQQAEAALRFLLSVQAVAA